MSTSLPSIDPAIADFAARLSAAWASFPNLGAASFAEQRAAAEQVRAPWRAGGPDLPRRDLFAPTPHGPVRLRLFGALEPARPAPVLVYLHGGGFTTFSLETHDRIMREYADRAGVAVVGVDYALSPEAKYPVALDQVTAAVDWVAAEGRGVGLDPARVALGGDSAGANLALSTAIRLRDAGRGDAIKALLLAYGFFDASTDSQSHRAHGAAGALLSNEELRGFAENYVGGTGREDDPLAFPARAALHDLPPAFHIVAELDPLADSDREVAARQRLAGGEVEARTYAGATHSFLEAVSIAPLAARALQESAEWLAARLAP